jgi:TonB-linked SusC/RagA family outer membrane protein
MPAPRLTRRSKPSLFRSSIPVLAAVGLTFGSLPAQTTTGTVTGTVTDVATGQTLETAQVYLPALSMGGLTNQRGQFLLLNVPAGSHELRVELIGYLPAVETVTVSPGATTTVQVPMEVTVLQLQELVVTGVAGETPRVKLPFTVEKVDFKEMPVPHANAGALLQGKIPGARVVRGTGQAGAETEIMLRGPTTIMGSQTPLIIVDGVITDNRLADIDALDVESIEVVKGAAAASLYGSRAQNGVIQIQTRRGAGLRTDQSRVTFRSELGFQELASRIGLSQAHPYKIENGNYVDQDGNPIPFGPGVVLQTGDPSTTFQDQAFLGPTFDHIDSFFDPGDFINEYVAVEGKTGSTNYRASFSYNKEQGIVDSHEGFNRKNFRINLDHQLWESLDVSLNTFFAKSWKDDLAPEGNPFRDLTFIGANADLLATDPDGTLKLQPDPMSLTPNPLYLVQETYDIEDRGRFMGSAFVRWAPLSWFGLEANYSIDRADFNDELSTPKDFKRMNGVPDLGDLERNHTMSNDVNTSITASINKTWGDLTTRNRFRYLLEDQHFESFRTLGEEFAVADVPVLDNIVGPKLIQSSVTDVISEGYFFISALDYQGKYVGDVLFRRDGSSLFGPDERWANYFRGSFAWRMTQEGFWPDALDWIDEFKVRYSWGQAGGRPRFEAQYETYAVSEGYIAPDRLGNRALKPELTTEQEMGVEFVLWNKIAGGVTYADSRTEDQHFRVPLPGFAGFREQWRNAGEIESNTWEGYLEASIIERPDMSWSTRLNWDRTRQRIVELAVHPFRSGGYWFREGEPLGAMYGSRWARSCDDVTLRAANIDCGAFEVNQDGYFVPTGGAGVGNGISQSLWGTNVVIGTDEGGNPVEAGWGLPLPSMELIDGKPDENVRMGSTTADYAASWSNTFRWKNLSLYTLIDTEQGFDIYNRTRQFAYRDWKSADCDMLGKVDSEKLPLSYCSIVYNGNTVSSHFVEDGSYTKLREVSLRYTFDRDALGGFGESIGLDRATVNVIGRNLLTWTDYTGYDPEVAWPGFAVIYRTDAFWYPHFRQFTVAMEIVF